LSERSANAISGSIIQNSARWRLVGVNAADQAAVRNSFRALRDSVITAFQTQPGLKLSNQKL
jgi:hypothetical protein